MAKSIEKTKAKAKAKSVGVYPVTEIIGTGTSSWEQVARSAVEVVEINEYS